MWIAWPAHAASETLAVCQEPFTFPGRPSDLEDGRRVPSSASTRTRSASAVDEVAPCAKPHRNVRFP